MYALLLIAAFQVVPVDTITQTVTVPRPQITVVGDTTIVRVEVNTDSLAAGTERAAAALAEAIASSGETESGRGYHWEVRVALVLAGYGLYELRKWRKSRFPDVDVDVDVDGHEHKHKPKYPRKPG